MAYASGQVNNQVYNQVLRYGRLNLATSADIFYTKFVASGTFKNVYEGVFTSGLSINEPCVAKELISGPIFSDAGFKEEIDTTQVTQIIIDRFNMSGIIPADKMIVLNTPEIWYNPINGHRVLIETKIYGYEKYNSNTGWVKPNGGTGLEALQALSHFSYHDSEGRYLLADLQGGAATWGYLLTDPCIMTSGQAGSFGPSDLGLPGMIEFFRYHKCGRFCNKEWRRPNPSAGPRIKRGTSMVAPGAGGGGLPKAGRLTIGGGLPKGGDGHGQAGKAVPVWIPPYPMKYIPSPGPMYNMASFAFNHMSAGPIYFTAPPVYSFLLPPMSYLPVGPLYMAPPLLNNMVPAPLPNNMVPAPLPNNMVPAPLPNNMVPAPLPNNMVPAPLYNMEPPIIIMPPPVMNNFYNPIAKR